ncbi:hypothetical protein AB0K21_21875 [Streptosporangium sp. NPDC049248]|uniref:hypothetical protein n=1 Tax=Streptosporangium sp. NPDC049248 TaxID=3155651 RepID=UPI003442CC4D
MSSGVGTGGAAGTVGSGCAETKLTDTDGAGVTVFGAGVTVFGAGVTVTVGVTVGGAVVTDTDTDGAGVIVVVTDTVADTVVVDVTVSVTVMAGTGFSGTGTGAAVAVAVVRSTAQAVRMAVAAAAAAPLALIESIMATAYGSFGMPDDLLSHDHITTTRCFRRSGHRRPSREAVPRRCVLANRLFVRVGVGVGGVFSLARRYVAL